MTHRLVKSGLYASIVSERSVEVINGRVRGIAVSRSRFAGRVACCMMLVSGIIAVIAVAVAAVVIVFVIESIIMSLMLYNTPLY